MKNKPKISVVIPTCNRSGLLPRAINSVLSQTYSNYELHIVDDASEDNTIEVVHSLINGRRNVFFWQHEKNKGLSASRNTGVLHASGDYVAFLDDDDEWKPDRIKKQIELLDKLNKPNKDALGIIYCGCEIHISDENRVAFSEPKISGNIKEYLLKNNLGTIPSTFLFPKTVLEKLGGFDENLTSSIDHDIWMKLAEAGCHAYFVNEPLVITYENKGLISMVTNSKQRINGVEQYLSKWRKTYKDWFGFKEGKRYIMRYRTRVLGRLACKKLCEKKVKESFSLFSHVILKNKFALSEMTILLWLLFRTTLKHYTPPRLVNYLKK